jgi:hypothetical protein
VVESYIGGSVVEGEVRVVILKDQASSQLLHLQTVQISLRIPMLRVLPKDMMRTIGPSASHVPVRDVANFCGGKTERAVKCRVIIVEM